MLIHSINYSFRPYVLRDISQEILIALDHFGFKFNIVSDRSFLHEEGNRKSRRSIHLQSDAICARSAPPADPLSVAMMESFFSFKGVEFVDDLTPDIELIARPNRLTVEQWSLLVFICARLIEKSLGPDHRVIFEGMDVLEKTLREFLTGLDKAAEESLPPTLPSDWREPKAQLEMKPQVESYMTTVWARE